MSRGFHPDCLPRKGGTKKPHVPYDTVKIEVELSKSLGDASESPASAQRVF
jgi:predicted transcriptional regulator